MLNIQRFIVNMIEENCYVVNDDTKQAVIIDCGAFYPEERKAISDYISGNGLKPVRLLQTHCHFDHLFGAKFIYDEYGLKPEMETEELPLYENAPSHGKMFFGQDLSFEIPPHGQLFKEGDNLSFGSHSLLVIATPGHTPGGVCFYCKEEGVLFSGDSLFHHEIGRCDLPGGNELSLTSSLKSKILTLPENVKVLPGHGSATTVGEEKRSNPYLK